nr:MAG TPA: hypothetical protein [Caudoviricetes sp.]
MKRHTSCIPYIKGIGGSAEKAPPLHRGGL